MFKELESFEESILSHSDMHEVQWVTNSVSRQWVLHACLTCSLKCGNEDITFLAWGGQQMVGILVKSPCFWDDHAELCRGEWELEIGSACLGFQGGEGLAAMEVNQHSTLFWQEQESPEGCSSCWYQMLRKWRRSLVQAVRIPVTFLSVVSGSRSRKWR